jgi:hypothetical protein
MKWPVKGALNGQKKLTTIHLKDGIRPEMF